MNSIIRITAAVNKVNCANPLDCAEEMLALLEEIPGSDIIVFPQLALCSPSCGGMFANQSLTEQCSVAVERICAATKDRESYVIAGLVVEDWGGVASVMAIIHGGALVALVPAATGEQMLKNDGCSGNILPQDTVFACGSLRFCVMSGESESFMRDAAAISSRTGCDLIIAPMYRPAHAGLQSSLQRQAQAFSEGCGCAVALVNGGVGDTSSPWVYRGFAAVYECGALLCEQTAGHDGFFVSADLDCDIIRSCKRCGAYVPPTHRILPGVGRKGLLRDIRQNPFLPEENQERYLDELFDLQVRSLMARMENIGVTKLVIGVSGGLDSTVALLVACGAVDALGLERSSIVGITMPGFGTSDRTYFSALSLLEQLGVTARDIPIKEAVQQHLEDIAHSGRRDVTYENAQARERTQILLDVANTCAGIVVGTGDLSEMALGFSTFAGDHIASYNVNGCITKTVLRILADRLSKRAEFACAAEIVAEILDTPISPELLPPSQDGAIAQKTEDILGPYALYDFILYYFIRHGFRPSKLFFYACIAFTGVYEPAFIKEMLAKFIRRFCFGQFKRSCAPDAASLSEVNLMGVNYYIPSDLDPSFLLKELDSVTI